MWFGGLKPFSNFILHSLIKTLCGIYEMEFLAVIMRLGLSKIASHFQAYHATTGYIPASSEVKESDRLCSLQHWLACPPRTTASTIVS